MKMKYLSLTLAALMATTGLTACGSDDDDNYSAPTTTPDTGDTSDDGDTPDAGDNVDTPDAGDNVDTPDAGDNGDTPNSGPVTTDPEDNVGAAAESFDINTESSVVGQQYIRGSNSKFDKTPNTNDDLSNTGNATVLGGETLQNEKMTNIVVAQYPDNTVTDAQGNARKVKYLLGENPNANPSVTDPLSIQVNNDSEFNGGNLSALIYVEKDLEDTYTSYNEESKINTDNSRLTQVATSSTTDTDNDVRVFGKLSTNDDPDTNVVNSARYLANDDNTVTAGSMDQFEVTPIHLDQVQYGRVTGALDGLTADDIAGRNYIRAEFANKDFNGNTDQTDIYFYRGIEETNVTDMPTSGTYQYAGHALMYGIDNSYTGETDNGTSNSVAFGTESEALGNFVKATYNASNKTVEGSVYNIWDTDVNSTTDALKSVDLVKFDGAVTGNTIKGKANRTYKAGEAAFKGSFYGSNAAEMGGSFNSIKTGYDKAEWGGVFGAEKVTVDQPEPGPVFVPPINAVE